MSHKNILFSYVPAIFRNKVIFSYIYIAQLSYYLDTKSHCVHSLKRKLALRGLKHIMEMARRLARNSPNARLTRGWISFTRPLLPPAARILQGRAEPPVLDISTVDHASEKNSYKTTVDATLNLQELDAGQNKNCTN